MAAPRVNWLGDDGDADSRANFVLGDGTQMEFARETYAENVEDLLREDVVASHVSKRVHDDDLDVGDDAPDFQVHCLDEAGTVMRLLELKSEGRPLVVNFGSYS